MYYRKQSAGSAASNSPLVVVVHWQMLAFFLSIARCSLFSSKLLGSCSLLFFWPQATSHKGSEGTVQLTMGFLSCVAMPLARLYLYGSGCSTSVSRQDLLLPPPSTPCKQRQSNLYFAMPHAARYQYVVRHTVLLLQGRKSHINIHGRITCMNAWRRAAMRT